MLGAVDRGALVGRLSMGNPAPNGDFSGVIKNSFLIQGGTLGPALSEVMISGNIAQMLRDVLAVSRERIDTGSLLLPWLRIGQLNFS
jgi:PmbA protein